jgi:hypothetical protein
MANGFYKAQNGSYIIVENNKFHGFQRDSLASIIDPNKHMSNGYFHGIDKVISNPQLSINQTIVSSNISVLPQVNPQYIKFRELVALAGLTSKDFGNITAIDINKKFTLFVPSNESIIAAEVAGKLPKTGAQGSQTLSGTEKARLINYIKYFFVADQEIFTDGSKTGAFNTSKLDPLSTSANVLYLPLTVGSSGNTISVTDNNGSTALVDTSQPSNWPENTLAIDGVIQIINNAFTSQY